MLWGTTFRVCFGALLQGLLSGTTSQVRFGGRSGVGPRFVRPSPTPTPPVVASLFILLSQVLVTTPPVTTVFSLLREAAPMVAVGVVIVAA